MKYLVNRETKEHRLYTEGDYNRLGHIHGKWDVVEADEEGWIPWNGGDCPLPEDVKCHWRTISGDAWTHGINSAELNWTGGQITHYRPILETAEKAACKESLQVESVFDRLKSAIAASESIPAIIAEIDALLPEGYCVTRCDVPPAGEPAKQPAEDMSDWRNWRKGDFVECISTVDDGAGDLIGIEIGDVRRITGISEKFGVRTSKYSWGKTKAYRFHSRPAKVTE